MSLNSKRTAWWREAIVYQIWPKSFHSGKGTPFGDIEGIIQKLDYIKSLGVNTIWLSPHYASPMVDEGYDISDYEDINPIFGTVQDAERLIKECHDRELRILFDLVITYTSDQHKFFKESRSSKNNPKRDWYIWRPARYDKEGKRQPPTNWIGAFYQSAWEWDEHTQEYYLHHYSIHQPDLNWRNEECRKAIMQSSMIFWLERGLDGFRVDTCTQYSKPEEFFDAPITNPKCRKIIENGKEIHQYLGEMGKIFENYDAMTVGECCDLSTSETLKYVSFARNELSMAFKPKVVCLGLGKVEPRVFEAWTYKQMFKEIEELQTEFDGTDGWSTSFLENHDLGRSVSRFADHSPVHHANACKMLSLYTTMLSGTPFIYQGQEIGMKNVPLSWDLSDYSDIATINYIRSLKDAGISDEEIEKKYKLDINLLARDNARTPVQWTDGPNAGFTTENVKPWMRINDDYEEINVASQLDDKCSILNFYRMAIDIRKINPELFVYGKFSLLLDYDKQDDEIKVLAFSKTSRSESSRKAIVLLNFSDHEKNLSIESMENGKVIISSHNSIIPIAPLQPFEGRVILL